MKADLLREFYRTNKRAKGEGGYWDRAAQFAHTNKAYARKFYHEHNKNGFKEIADPYPQQFPGEPQKPKEPREVTPETVEEDLIIRRFEAKVRDLNKTVKILTEKVEEAEARFDAALNIKQAVRLEKIRIIKSGKKHEATAIICISDIHLEQQVEADAVNGVNEYNPTIAAQRVRSVFANALKLVRMFQKDVDIKEIIIALLGDNIAGHINDDLKESNYMSPTEATPMVKGLLMEGIILFANCGFKITVPCSRGNHARNTPKKRFATGYRNSYEQMMYFDMAETFRLMKYENVHFVISKSEFTYVETYGLLNRFCHGDHFGYSAGVGGIFPPMLRWLNRKNSTDRKADCTFMGHWHQYYAAASKGFVVNGSVIGADPYGFQFGNDPPVQCIQLVDSKRGYTGNWPIVI